MCALYSDRGFNKRISYRIVVLCSNFATDADCVQLHQLPIDPNSKDLYVKCGDGILLWSVRAYSKHVFSRTLLCGRVIGRITRLARPSVRRSVCPSVCTSVTYGLLIQKRKDENKPELVEKTAHDRNNRCGDFQLKKSKVGSPEVKKNLTKMTHFSRDRC